MRHLSNTKTAHYGFIEHTLDDLIALTPALTSLARPTKFALSAFWGFGGFIGFPNGSIDIFWLLSFPSTEAELNEVVCQSTYSFSLSRMVPVQKCFCRRLTNRIWSSIGLYLPDKMKWSFK